MPSGWDFDPEFLDNPEQLPPFVGSIASSMFGASRRATAHDLRERLPLANRTCTAAERRPHTVVLDAVRAVVEDRDEERNHLYGPARLVLEEDLLNRHMLWVGPPGVGKTTRGILPVVQALLADVRRSVVVFDPKGDQFELIRDLAADAGRSRASVVRLNLTAPEASIGWNPLKPGISRTEALGIATALVMASEVKESHDSPFWKNTSIDLIVDVLLGLDQDGSRELSLPSLLEVLDLPRDDLLTWLNENGAHRFAGFLRSGSHNAETCLADTAMRLVALQDLDLCAVLSHNELDLDRLFRRPTVLVVEMNETRLEVLRPIFNVLVQQIFDHAIEAAERQPDCRLKWPLSVVIDEFGSAIGAIPRFPVYLNTLRSRRVSVIAAVQGLSQIHALYQGEAGPVLVGFSSKVYFAGVELEDAERTSQQSGTMTVEVPGPGNHTIWAPRRVFLAEEIARPRAHPVLGLPVTMLIADTPAFQAYLPPMFQLPRFRPLFQRQRNRRRRATRKEPLCYRPHDPRRIAAGGSRGGSKATLHRRLDELERVLGLKKAAAAHRTIWRNWRKICKDHPASLIRLGEQLLRRGIDIEQFFTLRAECQCDDPEVTLKFADYMAALSRHEEERRRSS